MDLLNHSSALKSLFEHSSLGIIVADSSGKITGVNRFAENMFGYSSGELVGLKIEVLLPTTLQKNHIQLRDGYFENPTARPMGTGRDLKAKRKDNSEFSVEISLSSYEHNGALFAVSFINDVTQRVLMKKQLVDQAEKLEFTVDQRTKELSKTLLELSQTNDNLVLEMEKSNKIEKQVRVALEKEKQLSELKTRFVSMASHEFRTPLGGIMTSAALIEKYTESEQQSKRDKHIRTIKKSVRNLTNILNDFLSLDKLQENKVKSNSRKFNFKTFLEDLLEDFSELKKERQRINFSYDSNIDVINQDKDILRNVVTNLVSNAIKYSKDDGEIIAKVESNSDEMILSIEDFGMGIPDNDQQFLFERFFRAGNVTTVQGTGLGLNIVKKYLELIDGVIDFKSEQNIGTTFTVRFPMEKK